MNNPDSYKTDDYELSYAMDKHSLTVTQRWRGNEAHRGLCRIVFTPEETVALSCFMAEDTKKYGAYSGIDDWVGIS